MLFRGKDVTGANPSTLKAAGVSYVTQDINSFPLLTVEENLMMGAWVFRRDAPASPASSSRSTPCFRS